MSRAYGNTETDDRDPFPDGYDDRALGKMQAGEREPRIARELNNMGRNWEQLTSTLSTLFDKLSPVLGPTHPSDAETAGQDGDQISDVAANIRAHTEDMRRMRGQVEYILERLEV